MTLFTLLVYISNNFWDKIMRTHISLLRSSCNNKHSTPDREMKYDMLHQLQNQNKKENNTNYIAIYI